MEFMLAFKSTGKEEFISNVSKWILIAGLPEDMLGGCGRSDSKRLSCSTPFAMMRTFVKDDKQTILFIETRARPNLLTD